MKYALIGMLCLSFASLSLNGCQSYPEQPKYPSLGKKIPVNHFVPFELRPFELPPKVEYMDTNQSVPQAIIVVQPPSLIVAEDSENNSFINTPIAVESVIKEANNVKKN